MEIKEAVEELKKAPASAGFNYCKESREAVNIICNSIASGEYQLCKVDKAIERMRSKKFAGLANTDIHCGFDAGIECAIDILKEACL